MVFLQLTKRNECMLNDKWFSYKGESIIEYIVLKFNDIPFEELQLPEVSLQKKRASV